MSPDRPVPPTVQAAIAQQLAAAMGGPWDTFDSREQAEFMRQASVALDTLRALELAERAELLEDLRQEDTWPELAPPAQISVREAVSLGYVANSDSLPTMTNDQLHILADSAHWLLSMGSGIAGAQVVHRTLTCVGSYRDDGESWLEVGAFVPAPGGTPVAVLAQIVPPDTSPGQAQDGGQ